MATRSRLWFDELMSGFRVLETALVVLLCLVGADGVAQAQEAPRPFAVRPGFENAKQAEFQRSVGDRRVVYRYAWRQPDGTPERIDFAFDRATVEGLRDAFQGYDPVRQKDHAYRAALDAASRTPPGIALRLQRSGDDIEIQAEGTDETLMRREMARVQATWKRAAEDYVTESGLIHRPGNVVEVDLLRFATEYVDVMRPLALAFARRTQGLDDRTAVEILLGFFQSIPYQDIEPPRGRGFRTPVGLIEANGGDCDTKAVAFAATLRAMRPTMGIAFVMLEHHVLAAVELPEAAGEYLLRLDRRAHLFVEPVGPGLLPIGHVGEDSYREIAAKRFRVLSLPTR